MLWSFQKSSLAASGPTMQGLDIVEQRGPCCARGPARAIGHRAMRLWESADPGNGTKAEDPCP